jgi:ribosome recycling factor
MTRARDLQRCDVVDDIVNDCEDGMKKAIDAFKRDLAKVRTGRANLSLLDGVKVDYYGTPTPLNQVATLNVADARLITIKPWEKNMLAPIEKAIRSSDLGLNPVADSEIIRVPVPPLTQERRKELVKVIKKTTEDGRVAVRGARRDANELLKDALKSKDISEDDSKNGQKKIQDLTDRYIKELDDLGAAKEKEILEV